MPIGATVSADELLKWAETLPNVSSQQIERLKRLAPNLTEEELSSLKVTLEQSYEESKTSESFLNQVAARQMEFVADENRNKLQKKEAKEKESDMRNADQLVNNI